MAKKITPAEVVANEVMAQLKDGTVPWRMSWDLPHNFITGGQYHGMNSVLLMKASLEFGDVRFATKNHILSKDGQILPEFETKNSVITFSNKKGYMKSLNDHCKQCKNFKNSGECSMNAKKEVWRKAHAKTDTGCTDFRYKKWSNVYSQRFFRVWNIQQTTLKDDPKFARTETPTANYTKANQIISNCGIRIKEGSYPEYCREHDLVYVPPVKSFKESEAAYYNTFKGLALATGTSDRLNRRSCDEYDELYEEIVGSITAMMLCTECGIKTHVATNAGYIESILERMDEDHLLVQLAAGHAKKSQEYLMKTLVKKQAIKVA